MGSCSNLHITLFTTFIYFQLLSLQLTQSVDIIKVLTDNHDFNILTSLLSASGVIQDFNNAQGNVGVTIFAPTDADFAKLSQSGRFQSLGAQQKALVLKFHGIHSYYPQGILKTLVNPFQPTFATEATSAGSYRFSLSQFQGKAGIQTGIGNRSVVLNTIYDQKPVAIYSVSDVLLPKEIFQ
ncbi:PREDICTED: fasciclin-like arabinogalactan protein 4 [Lupinus angustifolius]|uniref:fasciclin-like arabinogalactan protein 4 n=1 Tax=Lupinus angustifolius TaxID=3871 RepID=UPI00092E9F3E|nr:PREDICTED: fasciclin-like arabinogalactan protein 4 [Lupinus angustifolius]